MSEPSIDEQREEILESLRLESELPTKGIYMQPGVQVKEVDLSKEVNDNFIKEIIKVESVDEEEAKKILESIEGLWFPPHE